MINYVSFNNGSMKKGSKLDYKKPGKEGCVLISLTKPTDKEISKVASDFGFDARTISILQSKTPMKKLPQKPFQFLMKSASFDGKKLTFSRNWIIITGQSLVMVSNKENTNSLKMLDIYVRESGAPKSACELLTIMVQHEVERNYPLIDRLEETIKTTELEAADIKRGKNLNINDLLELKSMLFKLSTQIWALKRAVSIVRTGGTRITIDPKSSRALTEINETLLHQAEDVITQREMMTDSIRIYATNVTTRLTEKAHEAHERIKNLTTYAFLIILPGLLIGKFSMNTAEIPLSNNPLGFYTLIGTVLLAFVITFGYAKKKRWL
jgi:Mg2+ and Co2+ transporter CorA